MSTQSIQERAEAHLQSQYGSSSEECPIAYECYIKGASDERALMSEQDAELKLENDRLYIKFDELERKLSGLSEQWVSVDTPPDHGMPGLLRHDYGNRIEYSTDVWCDEVIKFISLNCISHYQVIQPLAPVINKGENTNG